MLEVQDFYSRPLLQLSNSCRSSLSSLVMGDVSLAYVQPPTPFTMCSAPVHALCQVGDVTPRGRLLDVDCHLALIQKQLQGSSALIPWISLAYSALHCPLSLFLIFFAVVAVSLIFILQSEFWCRLLLLSRYITDEWLLHSSLGKWRRLQNHLLAMVDLFRFYATFMAGAPGTAAAPSITGITDRDLPYTEICLAPRLLLRPLCLVHKSHQVSGTKADKQAHTHRFLINFQIKRIQAYNKILDEIYQTNWWQKKFRSHNKRH